MRFYLGIHRAEWLRSTSVPVFVSRRILARYRTLPVAAQPWCLDSGGFTELSMHGRWTISAADYVAEVQRIADGVGLMEWAAPMDAMCEPWVLEKSRGWLGGTVAAHQQWTVANFIELRTLAPDLPFIPVLQGWQRDDYLRHVDSYAAAGIDLARLPTVGLGSVCRRQATGEIAAIVAELAGLGLRLHGFGVKTTGIAAYGPLLKSADSMAWSYGGRRRSPCPESDNRKNCANCWHHAITWRQRVVDRYALSGGSIE